MTLTNRALAVLPAAAVAPVVIGLNAAHTPDYATGLAGGVLIGLAIVGLARQRRCAV